MRNLRIVVALALAGGACGTLEELRQRSLASNCQSDNAYGAGVNQGKNGWDMNTAYYDGCPVGVQASAKDAYRRGFEAGMNHLPERIIVDETVRHSNR